MTWLAGYLAVGVVVFAVALVSDRLATRKKRRLAKLFADALNPERRTLRYRVLNNVVVPTLTGVLMVAAWPVAVGKKLRDVFSARTDAAPQAGPTPLSLDVEEPVFAVTPSGLGEPISLEKIERRETVLDPLGAAPAVAFGHLNGAWRKFLEAVGPQDTLRTFSARWGATWRHEELRSGYVVVRGESIGPHFVTSLRAPDEFQDE